MSLVIDANVFVASALVEDVFHAVCAEFLLEARLEGETIYEPVLVLAEVAGVLSRVRQDHAAGDVAVLRIERFPRMRLRAADGPFARRAARLAARFALAGADAHYLALAVEFSSTLVTSDDELRERGASAAHILTPEEWLRENARQG